MEAGAGVRHRMIPTNGVRLHAVEAGPADGPLVLLLHGFPELWYAWRHQIAPLAAAGLRVLVPDQRGYNTSDKPRGVAAYGLDELARDAVGLIAEAGRERAVIVGHDWGGAVAWWMAQRFPERVERLVAINMPHLDVMWRHLWHDRGQRRRSRYVFFFQLPWLPERKLRRDGWAVARRALVKTSRPGTFSGAALEIYQKAWRQPGAITAMLNWYRAAFWARPRPLPDPRVRVPVLLLWGARDRFLGIEMAEPSADLCDDGRLVVLPEATHWVHLEEPERICREILDFCPGR